MAESVCEVKPPNRVAGDGGYKNKTVLITGATGFLGKVLIEKMLRSCPLVKKIYVIARNKKGKSPQTRMKEIFTNPLFDLLKKTRGEEILEKVTAINGEISEVGLGLSKEDWSTLAEEVEIIFHLAATVRFDEPFKKAVLLNVRGTKVLLDLAKECKKLLVFAHVSTAYVHPHERVLFEKTYPPPANPHDIIKVVELLDANVVDALAVKLKGDSPNTYTYTKALAEGLVAEQMDNLPVIILRPSVVVPAWIEPIRGWTDNLNGPAGLLVAAGKGVLRTMYCNKTTYADFLPVDIAANGMLTTAYDYMNHRTRRVYHLTSSAMFKVTWNELIETGKGIVTTTVPLNWAVWYPGGSMKSSRFLHNISAVFFHYIPAIFLDSLIILTGNKPVLWKVQQRLSKGFELFEYYTNHQWDFSDEKSVQAKKLLNTTEREVYKLDAEGMVLEEYLTYCTRATRLYVLKESDASLPTARRHIKIMWALDRLVKLIFVMGFVYVLLKYLICPVLGIDF